MAHKNSKTSVLGPVVMVGMLMLSPFGVEGQGQAEYYGLIDMLFTSYKPAVRPSANGTHTVVSVQMHLQSVVDLDEKDQVLTTSVTLVAEWLDEYLSWDPANYANITYISYPQKSLWTPDLVIDNSVESQEQLGYNESPTAISYEGRITWKPSEILRTSCDIDVTYYPFDTQICVIILSTWVSTKEQIDIDPYLSGQETAISLDDYSKSGTWNLVSTSYKSLPNEGDLTRIQFELKLKRLSTFYILNIIMPVLLLSFTASLVFLLPADSGEKVGMSITVLLAYAVYLTIISENMPQTSLQISILSVYLTLLLGVTTVGVVATVFILCLHHKPDDIPVGDRIIRYTRKIRNALCLNVEKAKKKKKKENETEDSESQNHLNFKAPKDTRLLSRASVAPSSIQVKEKITPFVEEETEEEIDWTKVAEAFDRLFFFLTSIFILLVTTVCMSLLVFH